MLSPSAGGFHPPCLRQPLLGKTTFKEGCRHGRSTLVGRTHEQHGLHFGEYPLGLTQTKVKKQRNLDTRQ
jgi:hypothetical protein